MSRISPEAQNPSVQVASVSTSQQVRMDSHPQSSSSQVTSRVIRNVTYTRTDIDLSAEVLLNLTTCGICLEVFRDPKSLPCLHSFCKRCLITLTENDNSMPFPCPTCRRLCGTSVTSLPDDFKSKLLLDTMRQRERDRQQLNLPEPTPVAIQPKTSKSQPVLCQTHGNRRCEFFCEECNIPICVKCVSVDHCGHCYIDVFEDSQYLIDEMERFVEGINRDIHKLEETNTDIDIMLCEFSYNLDERTKKLKKLVELTATQIKQSYSQDLLAAQSDIRRQVIMHHNFINKTNEFLAALKDSLKDCAVFDIYADAKLHLDNSCMETPKFLFEKPPKFEWAPCIEYPITTALTQFFGQPGSVQLSNDAAINLINQLGLNCSPVASTSHASARSPEQMRCHTSLTDFLLNSSGTGTPGGARRKRHYQVSASNARRPSPAVEALFSSVSSINSAAATMPDSQQLQLNNLLDQEPDSNQSILRSLLPNSVSSASAPTSGNMSGDVAVSHPLTPFIVSSIRQGQENPSEPLVTGPQSANQNLAASNATSSADIIVPLIDLVSNSSRSETHQQNVMRPYEVQQFFQSLLSADSRHNSTEDARSSESEPRSNTNSGSSFPEMVANIVEANEGTGEEDGVTSPGAAVIAEETL